MVYIIRGVSYNKNLSIGRFALTVSEEYNIGVGAIARNMMKGLVAKMEKTRSMEVEIIDRARKIYDRYEWLKARLLTRYNVYYDSATEPEEILMINEWYEETRAYLEKRFVREFTKAVKEVEVC